MEASEHRPRKRAPSTRRAQILDAAIRVFERRGIDAPVSDITDEAGVAKGTFYLYFNTRDDVFAALGERLSEHVATELARLRIPRDVAGWPAYLERLVKRAIAIQVDGDSVHHLLRSLPHHGDASSVDPIRLRLRAILAEGVSQGALSIGDVTTTADVLYDLLHAAGDRAAAQPDQAGAITTAAQDLVLHGLTARQ